MNRIYASLLLVAMTVCTAKANVFSTDNAIPVAPALPELPHKAINLPYDMERVNNLDKNKIVRVIDTSYPATRVDAVAEDLVGNYSVTYTDYMKPLNNEKTDFLIANSTAEIKEEDFIPDDYTLRFPFYYIEDYIYIEIPIHVENNTITIRTESYKTDAGMMSLRVERFINDGENSRYEKLDEISTKFTGSGFSFDKDIRLTLVDEEADYMFFYAAFVTFQKSNAINKDMFSYGWKSLGTGVFQDGWLMSNSSMGEQSQWLYDVEIQQSEIDGNIYRILNPYAAGTPLGSQNEAANLCGSIQFNMSDPDHIYFYAVPANFVNEQIKISQFFATNNLTLLVEGYGWDVEPAVRMMEGAGFDLWSTYKEGVLTVPSRYIAEEDCYENDAWFSYPGLGLGVCPYYGTGWGGANRKPLNMEAKLWFPGVYEAGVEGVEADSDAPVRYYNLQGVEVANPEKGQLLIKRQGSKAEKIVF